MGPFDRSTAAAIAGKRRKRTAKMLRWVINFLCGRTAGACA